MHLEQLVLNIEKIKSIAFDVLKGSPDVMLLLTTYSTLYLKGSPPGTCERCLRNYYREICFNGIEKANEYIKMKNRTLEPNWVGIKYIRGSFFDSSLINDEQAEQALKAGILRNEHFIKLPTSLIEKEPEKETKTRQSRKPKK